MKFSRLDRTSIRKLAPGQSVSEHGIIAERTADGDVRYSINIMVRGQRIHRAVGRESQGVTRSQCEEIITKEQAAARTERFGLTEKRRTPTLAKAAVDYLARLEESGGRNLRVKRSHLTARLIPFFGTTPIDKITAFAIERYKRDRLAGGAAKGTINRELATLGHLLGRAVEWNWLDRLPARVPMFKEDAGRLTVLTDAETDQLLQAAIAGPDPDLWLFIEIARHTGMRHGEILRIRWQDCDINRRRIFVPEAKAGSRQQPIPQGLADILKREQLPSGYVFPARYSRSTKGHIDTFEHPFRRAVVDAGLDPKTVTPHTLRHTVITKLVQAGTDLPTIMAISGHKTVKMVMRYSHVSAPHIDAAITTLENAVTPELHRRRLRMGQDPRQPS